MKAKNIIFIHGWASGPYVWLHQVSHFKNKCNVYTPELFGRSFNIMADNVCDFITKQKLENVCLVGWSLGGMVSLQAASRLKDRIKRLVLIGTTVRFVQAEDYSHAVPREVVEKIHKRMKTDFEGTLRWFYKFCFSPNERSRNEFSEVMKLLGDLIAPFNEDMLLSGLEILMDLDIRHLLDGIDIPSLIIHGSEDKICPPQAAEFLAKRLKNARIRVIDKAGHAPFLTEPAKVNLLIEDFLSR